MEISAKRVLYDADIDEIEKLLGYNWFQPSYISLHKVIQPIRISALAALSNSSHRLGADTLAAFIIFALARHTICIAANVAKTSSCERPSSPIRERSASSDDETRLSASSLDNS
jgi:hypothetical protein